MVRNLLWAIARAVAATDIQQYNNSTQIQQFNTTHFLTFVCCAGDSCSRLLLWTALSATLVVLIPFHTVTAAWRSLSLQQLDFAQ